jgi:hypothetical protein
MTITTLNKVVLERIELTFSSTYGAEYLNQLTEDINRIYSDKKVTWAKSIGTKVIHCRTIKELVAEIVIYAELTDVQTTEYVLRFA